MFTRIIELSSENGFTASKLLIKTNQQFLLIKAKFLPREQTWCHDFQTTSIIKTDV